MTAAPLKIRLYGDPCLRKKSVPVIYVGPTEQSLLQAMLAAMREHKGVGLAAPQVGVNQQIFIADIGDGPLAFINPRIIKKSGVDVIEEGCLSIPGVTVMVRRPERIVVRYIDENNQPHEKVYDEMMARVIQHEVDHLDGKLIVDYAGIKEKIKLRAQLKELERRQKGIE
ncbi:MAG TPA: peptide deformylase [Candidatus Omnitrophica bacterium]|nr:peptide deformylase [Candidatus Omnitrophota bacterium]HCI44027.1 peptide deformylase [Candidatus Omnitrophota bacterium]